MFSGITKIYYRKTVGHVFTKPLHIEGTEIFFPSTLFFIVVHISAARRCECMQTENGRSGGEVVRVLEYHTSKSVVTVQRAFRAKYAKDPPTDKTGYSSHHCHVTSLT
jgi:hypothetical protein